MIFDRWSRDIFTRTLFDKYRSPAVLPDSDQLDTPVDYGDFALWQRACYTEHWLEKNLAEWRAYFGDAPVPTCIPGDSVPGPGNVATAGRVSRAIPVPIVRRALECCHRMGISSFAFHIAAFFFLLQKYTGQDDLMICSPVAGRQNRQTRSIIGFFSNVLVYRVVLDPSATIERAINTVVERTRGFQTFSELPFDTVATSPELRTLPIDSALFAFHNTPARIIDTGDLTVRPYSIDRRLADQRLSFSIYRRENRWYSHVSYRTEAYSSEFIEALVACYQELLGALATLPSTTSLRELSLRTGPIASQHPP
jgi:hypothetical protein